ncbi:MAG TPA: transglutaminaseTgpA domain-containing protein, partial [Thermoleophilaceae bacterium]
VSAADSAPATRVADAPAPAGVLPLRLAAFAALALFGAAHWQTLVTDPSSGRTLLMVLVVTAGGAPLALLGRLAAAPAQPLRFGGYTVPVPEAVTTLMRGRGRAWAVAGAGVLVALATLLLGLIVAGLPLRLLAPSHWGELADGLDRGLAGAQIVDWPYGGADAWIRLVILLGAPLLATSAAVCAFAPVRYGGRLLRGMALLTLLVLYGLPATEHDLGAPLLRGLALLLLVAAWLWLPRLNRRDATLAAVAVVAVGALSLPVAAALDSDKAWWDYGGLTWFGDGKRVTFDWTHSYGPLDWPRDGTTLLYVKSDRPHYWKAESLDVFDGFRWARSAGQDNVNVGAELPLQRPDGNRRWDYYEVNPAWNIRARFTVRSLSTNLIVGAGLTYTVDGVERRSSSGDGTMTAREPLEKGDSYEIGAYAPDPSAAQMRGAPDGYPGTLARYTQISLPAPGESALDDDPHESASARSAKIVARPLASVPLRAAGYRDSGLSARQLRASPYRDVFALARRLTATQPTAYDAVKSVENYLQRNYTYSERPPSERYPLVAFLFQDEIGYCQQFSGAMALLLRMSGIPTRVASGFSPGSYNKDSGEYRVRDLDAHSWVEVYFTGIGWVPFDPTPSAAPAESQSNGAGATSAARGDAGEVRALADGAGSAASERGTDTGDAAAAGDDATSGLLPLLVLVLVAGAAAGLLAARRLRRRRALSRAEHADARLLELRRALERLGWDVPAQTTLLDLERRLDRSVGPSAAGYVAALRAHRYDPRTPDMPGAGERRALRRALTAGRGLRVRLRGLLALPPTGPGAA